jgi:hypothetical protein
MAAFRRAAMMRARGVGNPDGRPVMQPAIRSQADVLMEIFAMARYLLWVGNRSGDSREKV